MMGWFNARYGSRKGFVESQRHQLLYYLGRYRQYEVPWEEVRRLVFVCTGNICRSAFSEAVAKSLGVDAISVGVHAIEGASADAHASRIAQEMGYSLADHRTTPVMYPLFRNTDLLVAMEPWQAQLVQENLARKHHTTLLGLWGEPLRPYIHDPFMHSDEYFRHCFDYIEKCVQAITAKIR